MKSFAAGNYIGNIFGMLPASILPLIIITLPYAQESTYIFIIN
jgi:hypothetical protein